MALRFTQRFCRAATGRRDGRCGAVTMIQRFGSALNLNLHFHIVHVDAFVQSLDGTDRSAWLPLEGERLVWESEPD